MLELRVKKLYEDAKLPTKANKTDAGIDFYYYRTNKDSEYMIINSLERVLVSTGVAVEIPPGYCLQLWDRSGLSTKQGLHRLAGVIDETYRGEVKVCLVNLSTATSVLANGDKIIQGLLVPVPQCEIVEVDALSDTERGEKGFGSSG